MPLQFGLGFPRFLSIEPPADLNGPAPTRAQEFISDYLNVPAILRKDRLQYMTQLRLQNDSMSKRALSCLSAPDVDWRRHIFDAADSKGLHMWMAKRDWLYAASDKEWARLLEEAAMQEKDQIGTLEPV